MDDPVGLALRRAGVDADFRTVGDDALWRAEFETRGQPIPVLLLRSSGDEYFVAFSAVSVPELPALEDLSLETVCGLLRANSEVRLAKLEYVDADHGRYLFAVSECSIEGFTGAKLQRRMAACAQLAARAAAVLRGDQG